MPETHIAHAIATFSELGIATSSILIVDATRWRAITEAYRTDPLGMQNLLIQAKSLGAYYFRSYHILIRINGWFCFALRALPAFALFLGLYALAGISFYPAAISKHLSFLSFERETLDPIYLIMAVLSFVIAMLTAKTEKNSASLEDRIKSIPVE